MIFRSGSPREWTPHDMRLTGSTLMQALAILHDIIDRCQNHVLDGGRVRRRQLQHGFADEKKTLDKLGMQMDTILCQTGRA